MRLLYLLDHPHHPRQVSFRHGRAGGETQPIPEQRLGHRTADDLAALEHRLAGASASTRGGIRCLHFPTPGGSPYRCVTISVAPGGG